MDEKKVKELIEYDGPDRIVHFTDYLKIKESDRQQTATFRGTYPLFDDKLDGLSTGEVTVITGKTGEGKTLFAESYLRGLLIKNKDLKACIFSFEVTPEALMQKYKDSPTMPLFLPLSLKTSDMTWLLERCWEAAVKENCNIFLLDHLHFLIDMAEKFNMSLNIGKFMRELKWKIAMELNVAVLLIAHQKGVAKNEEPSLEDTRDSSFICQEADNVFVVWRRKNFTDSELLKLDLENTQYASKIKSRSASIHTFKAYDDAASDGFAMVQIAKARRNGAFRWNKLFQKNGAFLEEV